MVAECGWPLVFQDYWARFPCPNGEPVTTIPSDYGMAYQFFRTDTTLLPPLEASIRELHAMVGNAGDASAFSILPGHGGTGVTISLLAAMAEAHTGPAPLQVFAQAPYYFDYQNWPSIADKTKLVWNASASADDPEVRAAGPLSSVPIPGARAAV